MIEFKSFNKIEQIGRLYMSITQKLHGTNAQILIYKTENGLDLLCGSRTRWLTPADDNYGFANFVYANKQEFIDKLGVGRHFGEWCGPGINSGEGLEEKRFYLFNWNKWKDSRLLPDRVYTVPVLYVGKFEWKEIDFVMATLKQNGSRISPGFMRPEGIVIEINEKFYKKTFDIEEVPWTQDNRKEKTRKPRDERVDALLQPKRLEKLLSRDEKYMINYPSSLPEICRDYIKDLEEEGQIAGSEEEIKAFKKILGRYIFSFIKAHI